MNTSTFVGIGAGLVLIIYSIVLGGDVTKFFDLPSVLIVVGGVVCATIASYSFGQLKMFIGSLRDVFQKPDINLNTDLEQILELANTARREGLLALDGVTFTEPFLQKGIELIVDGTDSELVKEILDSEISLIDEKDQDSIKVFYSMAQFAPAFGMVGTLIGLINMLMFLSDSATLGPSMATALITTFYGVVLANLLFLPSASKLKTANALRMTRYQMMLEGVLALQNGDNPRLIREKLISFIPLTDRANPGSTETKEQGGALPDGQTAAAE